MFQIQLHCWAHKSQQHTLSWAWSKPGTRLFTSQERTAWWNPHRLSQHLSTSFVAPGLATPKDTTKTHLNGSKANMEMIWCIYMMIFLSLSIYLSIHPSIFLSFFLIHPSIYLSISLCLSLSLCMYIYIYIYIAIHKGENTWIYTMSLC